MGTIYNRRPVNQAGTLTASSNVTITKTLSASSRMSATRRQTATTAATVLDNYGISSVARKSSAGASTQLYTLAAPTQVGLEKTIFAIDAGSTRTCRVTLTAASFHSTGNSTTLTKLTFNAGNDAVRLVATSTAKWLIVSNVGSVTIA